MPNINLLCNKSFVSHENNNNAIFSLVKSKVVDIYTAITVNYTVTGTGVGEVSLVSGSAIIPSGSKRIDIPITPINAPNGISPDREITIEITPDASYNINYVGYQGSLTLKIKDKQPILSFPTATGAGAYVTGGRGGDIHHVTNLLDNGSVGSFRWALLQPRPAIIVFDVSGVIELQNNMRISGNNLTIAGQTAPEGGITVTCPVNKDLYIDNPVNNIIMRYIRIRSQFDNKTSFKVDSDKFLDGSSYAHDIILDHLSVSWSGLQGFTVRGIDTYRITFQNGLIGESKTGSLFGDTSSDFTGTSRNNTFARTMFYNLSHRTPNSASDGVDIYNNIVYNWNNRLSVIVNGASVNHFNNYYFLGNRNSLFTQWQSQPPVWQVNAGTNSSPTKDISIYANGNEVQNLWEDLTLDETETLWIEHAVSGQTERLNPDFFDGTKKPMQGYVGTILTAKQASTIIPIDTGAYKYINSDGTVGVYRDEVDNRYVNNVVNDTPESYTCCFSGVNSNRHSAIESTSYINFLSSVTTTPINTRPSNYYNEAKSADIPEVWFDANVPIGETATDLAPSGYMWIEEFVNEVDGDSPAPPPPPPPPPSPTGKLSIQIKILISQ